LTNLSVFEGAFDRVAAQEIAQVEICVLSELVDRSLLSVVEKGRFILARIIRRFCLERLAREPAAEKALRDRYCKYYLMILVENQTSLMSDQMLETRQRILEDLSHMLGAIRWANQSWKDVALKPVLTALLTFYAVYGWFKGVELFGKLVEERKALADEGEKDAHRSNSAIITGEIYKAFLLCNLGQIKECEAISSSHLQALYDLGQEHERSVCLHNIGVTASFTGDYEKGVRFLEEAILIGQSSQFILWPTYLLWLGHAHFLLGEYEQGLLSLEKCRGIFMKDGNYWGAGFAITKMGIAADGMGNHVKAMQYHREANEIFRKTENKAGQAYSFSRMSMSASFLNEFEDALKFAKDAFEKFEEIRHRWGMAGALTRMGFANLGVGENDQACGFLIDALKLSQSDQMAPLCLYTLAGYACLCDKCGKKQEGLDLMRYVIQHPKTPEIYLANGIHFFKKQQQKLFRRWFEQRHKHQNDQTLSQVINQILQKSD